MLYKVEMHMVELNFCFVAHRNLNKQTKTKPGTMLIKAEENIFVKLDQKICYYFF